MAVPEPGTAPEQRDPDDSELEMPPRRSPGRLRKILLTGLLVGALGAVGAIGYGFIWYDQATKPDRGTPAASADSYLGALLVDRDESRASVYACGDHGGLAEIRRLRDEIVARERQLGVGIVVNLEDLLVEQQPADGQAVVLITVRRSAAVDGVQQSITDRWRFRVEDRDGWRVCAATKAS